MLLHYFFSFLFVVCATSANDILFSDNYVNLLDGNVHKGSPCEDKVAAALSVLKTESDHKLVTMEKNIVDKLEETINRKLYILENKIPDRLEEYLDRKFFKLEKKILEKLEESMIERLDVSKLNLNASDKIVHNNFSNYIIIDVSNVKIDDLEKKIPVFSKNNSSYLDIFTNRTSEIENYINHTFSEIEKQLNDINNNTLRCKHYDLNKTIHNLEESVNQTYAALKKVIPDVEEYVDRKFEVLDKTLPEKVEEYINRRLDTIEKRIPDLEKTLSNKWDILEKIPDKIEHDIDHKLDAIQKKIPDLEEKINNKLTTLENMENKIFDEVFKSQHVLRCKERVTHGYNFYPLCRVDNETLNHVPVTLTDAGLIAFKMHIAIKVAKDGLILLSPVPNPGDNDDVFEIAVGVGGNLQTEVRLKMKRAGISYMTTPNILSATNYVGFFIEIADGKLEFGKEGGPPIITHSNANLKFIRYFGFGSWNNREAKFLYDCPAGYF